MSYDHKSMTIAYFRNIYPGLKCMPEGYYSNETN